MERPGWTDVPYNVLVSIFARLGGPDLVGASSSCKKWRQVYECPCLWRSMTFDFRQQPLWFNSQKIDAYVSKFGRNLVNLRIVCSNKQPVTPGELSQFTGTLLSGLSSVNNGQLTIKTFRVENLEFDDNWGRDNLDRLSVVLNIGRFLERQTKLEEVYLKSLTISEPYDSILFVTLSRSPSFKTLKVLCLENFSLSNYCLNEFNTNGLKGSDALEKLVLNYSLLNVLRFDVLWNSFRAKLQLLEVVCTGTRDAFLGEDDLIGPDRWKLLSYLFPQVRVSIVFKQPVSDFTKYLVDGIPLSAFQWTETQIAGVNIGTRASNVLTQLAQLYTNTIRSVTLNLNGQRRAPVTKESVFNFVTACRNLTKLDFSESLMDEGLLEEIKADVRPVRGNVSNVIRILK